jgi:hypothetical protein
VSILITKPHIYLLSCLLFLSVFLFANTDSSKVVLKSWKLAQNGDLIHEEVDTNFYKFQIFNPIFFNSSSWAYTGQFGGNAFNNVLDENSVFDIYYLKQRENFIFNSSNRQYFNTKKQFTQLSFISGGKDQNLKVFHTQNVNKNLNFGLEYNLISGTGFYSNLKNRNNSFSIFSDYISRNYNFHFCYSYNKYFQTENGGLKSDTSTTDLNPSYFEVNLSNAQSSSKFSNLFVSQELKFGKAKDSISDKPLSLYHSFNFFNTSRRYGDANPSSGFYKGVYKDSLNADSILVSFLDSNSVPIYFDSLATFDSVFHRRYVNSIYFNTNFNKINVNIGFSNEIHLYSLMAKDSVLFDKYYPINDFHDSLINTSAIIAEFYNFKSNNFKWEFGGKYYFSGFKKSNFDLKLNFESYINTKNPDKISFISFNGSFSRLNPEFFEQTYSSNHYKWDSTFLSKDVTKIKLSYSKPNWKLSLGAKAFIFDNYIYYNELSLPRQTTSTFSVYSAFLNKNFKFHHFNFNNEIVYQYNQNDSILRIPSLVFYNSTFFDFKAFKKVLTLNIGFDFYYTSEYYSYAYNPAMSVFYLQNDNKTGNYPIIDIFVVAKLKRARFFAKLSHANYQIMTDNTLYTLAKYPIYGRTLYFGVSWNFYD